MKKRLIANNSINRFLYLQCTESSTGREMWCDVYEKFIVLVTTSQQG